MKKPQVSIIYVNYNTQTLAEASLYTVVKNIKGFSYEVIMVDNASAKFDPTALKKIYPRVKIVKQTQNIGFGGGNNAAASVAKGEILWLLNTDTVIPKENNLGYVVKFLQTHKKYAAATPLITNEEGRVQSAQIAYLPNGWRITAEKPVRLIVKLLPFTKGLFGQVNADYLPLQERDVEFATAASMFVSAKAFHKVGGFSKEFFMYYEDTDLCKKLIDKKYQIRFMPSAKVVHLLGKSNNSNYKRKKMYFASQDKYLEKYKPKTTKIAIKILRSPLIFWYWTIK